MKTLLGIQQKDEGLRRAAFIIHCSLVNKKDRADIQNIWPLPFDYGHKVETSRIERLKQRLTEFKQKENAGRGSQNGDHGRRERA
jgi:hypothetical protein